MSEALKPCPHCGNDGSGPIEHALHVSFQEHDWRAPSWTPQCDKCTATMGYFDSEEEAVEAWNTRTPPELPRDVVEAAAQYDQRMAEIGGCSDGYCVIQRPKGMHTNGGCHCWSDRMKMQRFAYAANKLRAALSLTGEGQAQEGGR